MGVAGRASITKNGETFVEMGNTSGPTCVEAQQTVRANKNESALPRWAFWLLVVLSAVIFLYIFVLAIITPMLIQVYGESIGQNSMAASSINFLSTDLTLDPARPTFVAMTAHAVIANTGRIGGKIGAAVVRVYYDAEFLGMMSMPEIAIVGNGQASVIPQLETGLEVANNDLMNRVIAATVAGETVVLGLSGPITVEADVMGLTISIDLQMQKDVAIVGKEITDAVAYDVDVTSGSATTLYTTVMQNLTNPSTNALYTNQELIFQLACPTASEDAAAVAAATGDAFTVIAEIFPEGVFSLARGFNQYNGTVELYKNGSDWESAAVTDTRDRFLSQWTMGQTQECRVRGPVRSAVPFVNNALDMAIAVQGSSQPDLVLSSQLEWSRLIAIPSGSQVVINPLSVEVKQDNLAFNLDGYSTSVASPNYFSYMLLGGGYCSGTATSGVVNADPVVLVPGGNATVAMNPSGLDCLGMQLAAVCCLNTPSAPGDLFLRATGSFDAQLEDFGAVISYQQSDIPFSCTGPLAGGAGEALCAAMHVSQVTKRGDYNKDFLSKPAANSADSAESA